VWPSANVHYRERLPIDVAATQCSHSLRAVERENPLLPVFVLEIPNVNIRIIVVDFGRLVVGFGVPTGNTEDGLRHGVPPSREQRSSNIPTISQYDTVQAERR
jgi:hypothetical protein